jgi:hypothetical protein
MSSWGHGAVGTRHVERNVEKYVLWARLTGMNWPGQRVRQPSKPTADGAQLNMGNLGVPKGQSGQQQTEF